MRTLFALVATLVITLAFPSFAYTELQTKMDELVQNKDFEGMERLISKTNQLNGREFHERNAELRKIFVEFKTTHPDYVAFMDEWLKEKPESYYAKTALGWHFYHIGWLVRGEDVSSKIYYKAREEMNVYFQESANLAFDAFLSRPSFAPARDLALRISMHVQAPQSKRALVYTATGVNLDRTTIKLALALYAPKWGGSLRMQKKICKDNEEGHFKVSGFTADMCFADVLLADVVNYRPQYLTREKFEWALAVMDAAPKDKMLDARWADATRIRPDREEAMQVIADILPKRNHPNFYYARQVEEQLDKPGFYDAYDKTIQEENRIKAARDPLNPKLVVSALHNSFSDYQKNPTPENLATYEGNWEKIMIYGRYDPSLFRMKAQRGLESYLQNPELLPEIIDAFEHVALLNNYNGGALGELHANISLLRGPAEMARDFTNMAIKHGQEPELGELEGIDYTLILALTDCPKARAVRLKRLICEANAYGDGCTGFNGMATWFDKELKVIKEQKICPARMKESEYNLSIPTRDWQPEPWYWKILNKLRQAFSLF